MKNRRNSILLASVIITIIMTAGLRANLVYNGDFEADPFDPLSIVTDYTYNGKHLPDDPDWVKEQEYTVYTNPILVHKLWANYTDHTTGTGNMMIVNAATAADQTVWEQTVTVLPNTDYIFTYWLSSSYHTNLAQLQCSFNGSTVGTTATAPGTTGVWQKVSYNWDSGASTTATIRLVDLTREAGGDDFAIDDISLVPEPGTLLLLGLGGLSLRLRSGQALRKRK